MRRALCLALAALLVLTLHAQSVSRINAPTFVSFSWDTSTDPTIGGYNLYAGGASFQYTNIVTTGNTNAFTWTNSFARGAPLFFNITTVYASGLESLFDGEASVQFTALPPTVTNVMAVAN